MQEKINNPNSVLSLVGHSLFGDVLTSDWISEPEDPSIPLPNNFIRVNNGQFVSVDVYFDRIM